MNMFNYIDDVLNELQQAWPNYALTLNEILDAYAIDENNLPSLLTEFENGLCCDNGLYLLDTSGLATHILGLRLIQRWKDQQSLVNYQQVLWLPYAKLAEIDIQPTATAAETLNNIASIFGEEHRYIADKKTLVIITGIDYANKEGPAALQQWLAHITTVHWLAIGNYIPKEFEELTQPVNITLPQLYFNMAYHICDGYQEEAISFPGKLLNKTITNIIQKAYQFDQDNPNGVFTVTRETLRSYLAGKTDSVPATEDTVDHKPPLLSAQTVIRILAGNFIPEGMANALTTLDTISKWYYAALSAARVHLRDTKKKYFVYSISGHIIIRRMTTNSANYLSDIGALEQYHIISISPDENIPEEVKWILNHVIQTENFENLNSKEILAALTNAKKTWSQQQTQLRNHALSKAQEIIPRTPVLFPKAAEEALKKINTIFRNDTTDAEIQESLKIPSNNTDASYQTIQRLVNEVLVTTAASEQQVAEIIRKILNGFDIDEQFDPCRLMVAVNTISETARYSEAFFAVFAMLDIARCDSESLPWQFSWRSFVSSPRRAAMIDLNIASWKDLILADGLDAIGGIHPMAHNGSFFQTNPTFVANGIAVAPRYGCSWPEIKAQLLYMHWLAISIQSNPIDIAPRILNFAFEVVEDFQLITPEDDLLIARDFRLLDRIATACNIEREDENILVRSQKPFQEILHLVADPQQIRIMTFNPEYGYYLEVPKIIRGTMETHCIHLNANQTHLIATKLDAAGRSKDALKLFNYLCEYHFFNLAFHLGRALLLVFHPDLLKDHNLLRDYCQQDLNYFNQYKTVDLEIQKQISYIDAVYSIRTTCERKYPEKAPINLIIDKIISVVDKAEKMVKQFVSTDEEYPMLCLLLAAAYRTLYAYCTDYQSKLPDQNDKKHYYVSLALGARSKAFFYLLNHARTFHRTADYLMKLDEQLFSDLLSKNGTLELISVTGLTKRERVPFPKDSSINMEIMNHYMHILSNVENTDRKNKISRNPVINLLQNVVNQIIISFKSHMLLNQDELRIRIKDVRQQTSIAKNKFAKYSSETLTFLKGFDKVSEIIIHPHKNRIGILIKCTWEIPAEILFAWTNILGVFMQVVIDHKWGPCFFIEVNDSFSSRAAYQPVPHPDSFITQTFVAIDTTGQEAFEQLSIVFNECLEKIRNWAPIADSNPRVSYHLFGNPTLLPSLVLVKRTEAIQDVLLVLPNGLPIHIIIAWLIARNFAYHWINDSRYGRCICLTEINILLGNRLFNEATNNAEAIREALRDQESKKSHMAEETKSSDKESVVSRNDQSSKKSDYLHSLNPEVTSASAWYQYLQLMLNEILANEQDVVSFEMYGVEVEKIYLELKDFFAALTIAINSSNEVEVKGLIENILKTLPSNSVTSFITLLLSMYLEIFLRGVFFLNETHISKWMAIITPLFESKHDNKIELSDTKQRTVIILKEYAATLEPELTEYQRMDLLQKQYYRLFGKRITEEELTTLFTGAEYRKESKGETHYETAGSGQCFFHAAFGVRNQDDIYVVENSQLLRDKWCSFMDSFDSVAEMPIMLQKLVEAVLEHFYESPEAAPREMNSAPILILRDNVKARIVEATELTKNLVSNLKAEILQGNTRLLLVMLAEIINRRPVDDQVRIALRRLLNQDAIEVVEIEQIRITLATEQSLRQEVTEILMSNQQYIENHIRDEIKNFANCYNSELYTDEYFNQNLAIEEIKKQFSHQQIVYKAYVAAIKQASYYVFMEEIPILATLSNTTIRLWYREQQGYFNYIDYVPDQELLEWLASGRQTTFNDIAWSNASEVSIFHNGFTMAGAAAGAHYSRANEDYLQLLKGAAESSQLSTRTKVSLINAEITQPASQHNNLTRNKVIKIVKKLNDFFEIGRLENTEQQTELLKELLLNVSWRCSEISKKDKFGKNGKLNNLGDKAWMLLDYLANALNLIEQELGTEVLRKVMLACSASFLELKHSFEQYLQTGILAEFNVTATEQNIGFYFDRFMLQKMAEALHITEAETLLPNIDQLIYQQAVLRVLEIIGEASKNISLATRSHDQTIPWQTMGSSGQNTLMSHLRNLIEHKRNRVAQINAKNHQLLRDFVLTSFPFLKHKILIMLEAFSNVITHARNTTIINFQELLAVEIKKQEKPEVNEQLIACRSTFETYYSRLQQTPVLHSVQIKLLATLVIDAAKQQLYAFLTLVDFSLVTEEDFISWIETIKDEASCVSKSLTALQYKEYFINAWRVAHGKKLLKAEKDSFILELDACKARTFDVAKFKEEFILLFGSNDRISEEVIQQIKDNIEFLPLLSTELKRLLALFVKARSMSAERKSELALTHSTVKDFALKVIGENPEEIAASIEQQWNAYKETADNHAADPNVKQLFYAFLLECIPKKIRTLIQFYLAQSSNESAAEILTEFIEAEDYSLLSCGGKSTDFSKSFHKLIEEANARITRNKANQLFELLTNKIADTNGDWQNVELNSALEEVCNSIASSIEITIEQKDIDSILKAKQNIINIAELIIKKENYLVLVLKKIGISAENLDQALVEITNIDASNQKKRKSIIQEKTKSFVHNYHLDLNLENKKELEELQNLVFEVKSEHVAEQDLNDLILKKKLDRIVKPYFKDTKEEEIITTDIGKLEVQLQSVAEKKKDQLKKKKFNNLYMGLKNILKNIFDADRAISKETIVVLWRLALTFGIAEADIEQSKNKAKEIAAVMNTSLAKNNIEVISTNLNVISSTEKQEFDEVEQVNPVNSKLKQEIDKLLKLLEQINFTFNLLFASKSKIEKSVFRLAAQYLLEDIGERCEYISGLESFSDSQIVSISLRNLYLLGMARKLMAHYPMSIDEEQLDFYLEQLILEGQIRLHDRTLNLDLQHWIKDRSFVATRFISLEQLENDYLNDIQTAIQALGFDLYFKIIQLDIGVQGDLNLLVQPHAETPLNRAQLIELELRLSHQLNANVRVFSIGTLQAQLKDKITEAHVKAISNARVYAQVFFRNKLQTLIKSKNFSRIGSITTSEFLTRADMEELWQYIVGQEINSYEDIKYYLDYPSRLMARIQFLLEDFNQNSSASSIAALTKFYKNFDQYILGPLLLHHEPIKIATASTGQGSELSYSVMPIVIGQELPRCIPKYYPAMIFGYTDQFQFILEQLETKQPKIWTYPELNHYLEQNKQENPFFEQWCMHFAIGGSATILKNNEDGSVIVCSEVMQQFNSMISVFVKLEKDEFEMLYVNLPDAGVGKEFYSKIDLFFSSFLSEVERRSINHPMPTAKTIATALVHKKVFFQDVFNPKRSISEEALSKASMVDYAYDQKTIDMEREACQTFRARRLETNAFLQSYLADSSSKYIAAVVRLIKVAQAKDDNFNFVLELILYDKEIDKISDQYFQQHEADLTYQAQTQDVEQNYRSQVLSTIGAAGHLVKSKYDLRKAVRLNPEDYVKDQTALLTIQELLAKRQKTILSYAQALEEDEAQFQVIATLEVDAFLKTRDIRIQFREVFETYIVDRQRTARDTESLTVKNAIKYFESAYLIYKKYSFIMSDIDEPETIKMLLKMYPKATQAQLADVMYRDLIVKYCAYQDSHSVFVVGLENRAQQPCMEFSNEAEFAFSQSQLTIEQQWLTEVSQERLPPIIADVINLNIDIFTQFAHVKISAKLELVIPDIVNGILGFSSELDRDLGQIHHKIAIGEFKLIVDMNQLRLVDVPDFVNRNFSSNFDREYGSKTTSTMALYEWETNTIEDLLEQHRAQWDPIKLDQYRNSAEFQNDKVKIERYYVFRNIYNRLKLAFSREVEYRTQIENREKFLESHQQFYRGESKQYAEQRLIEYQEAYAQNLVFGKDLFLQLLQTDFVKERILKVLRLAKTLKPIIATIKEHDNTLIYTRQILKQAIDNIVKQLIKELSQQIIISDEIRSELEDLSIFTHHHEPNYSPRFLKPVPNTRINQEQESDLPSKPFIEEPSRLKAFEKK